MDQYNTKGQIQQKRINTTKRKEEKKLKTKQKIPMTLIQQKRNNMTNMTMRDQYDQKNATTKKSQFNKKKTI